VQSAQPLLRHGIGTNLRRGNAAQHCRARAPRRMLDMAIDRGPSTLILPDAV
jgi:hypothetical protein